MPFNGEPSINLVANTFGSASTNDTDGQENSHAETSVSASDIRSKEEQASEMKYMVSFLKDNFERQNQMIQNIQI
jgi:hypothetical protein